MSRVEVIGDATLYHGDALDVLSDLARAPFADAVLTDPPYSSGGQFRGDRTQDTKVKYLQNNSGNQDKLSSFSGDNRDQRAFHFWSTLWASAAMRCSKPGAVALFFTDWRQLPVSTDYLQSGGWVWRGIVPWAKKSCRPQMGRFSASCEYVVWGSNGALPIERDVGCLPGFYSYSAPSDREHVTQKPDGLMEEMAQICPRGGVILDPFMGSGTTGVGAMRAGRKFVGIELDTHSFDIACRRLEDAQRQGRLIA